MMNYVTMGLSALALSAAMGLGYKLGAWRLETCRTELAAIQKTGEAGQALSKDAQAQLDQKQAALDQEHKAKIDKLNESFATERSDLQNQLGRLTARINAAQGKTASTDADLARVRRDMQAANASANAPLMQQLKDQERALLALQSQLAQQQASLVCLQAPVPREEVALLNRSLTSASVEVRP